ncbi:hypothetical protein RhiLY_01453 [Ceratobasidium sp. AG-Ba]|nr:hypothetical protein RhiLY_01453 [Ceratobasidium sp. AG-Ba]
MTNRGQKQTAAARVARQATRQSARQADKKRALEDTPEAEPPASSGKRVRSGTITSTSNPTEPSTPAPARARARPKLRVPQPETESEVENHSPIELPPSTKVIVMPNSAKSGVELIQRNPTVAEDKPAVQESTEVLMKSEKAVDRKEAVTASSNMIHLDESSEVELIDTQNDEPSGEVRSTDTPKLVKSKKKGPEQPVKGEKKPSLSPEWKARAKRSSQDSTDDEDTWNRDRDSDEDAVDRKKANQAEAMLEYKVPRLNGVRVLKLRADASYWEFRQEVDGIIDSTDEPSLGYNFGKRKDLKGKLRPRVLEDAQDYREMVKLVVDAINEEESRYRKEVKALEEAATTAKGKRGAPSKKKAAPAQEYIVRLTVTIDEGSSKKAKKSAGKDKKYVSGSRKMILDEEEDADMKSKTSKQLAWLGNLKAKTFCATHKRQCARLPGESGQPGRHVRLDNGDLLFWAEILALQNPEVTIFKAPKSLKLHERKSDEITDGAEVQPGGTGASTPSTPAQALAQPPPTHQYPPPFYPRWPPYFPPPTPGSGGYPPHPYGMPTPPTPTPTRAQPPNDPLLSEWLVQCDTHTVRGADGHKFSSLLPQFDACRITRVSNLARFDTPNQLREAVSDHPPKIPYGTAARLLEYAKADY